MSVDELIRGAYILYPEGKPWPVDSATGQRSLPLPPGQMFQSIKGSAGWVKSDLYTMNAKSESPATLEMMRGPMMQAVLAERFQLKLHREKRELKVFQLTVAKGGPKLQPAKPGSCTVLDPQKGPPVRAPGQTTPPIICAGFSRSDRGGLDVKGVALRDFCMTLSSAMDRDVIDATGISGRYDLHLDLSFSDFSHFRGASAEASPSGPIPFASDPGGTVTGALHKLGLTLQGAKITIESPVIDHVTKPGEN